MCVGAVSRRSVRGVRSRCGYGCLCRYGYRYGYGYGLRSSVSLVLPSTALSVNDQSSSSPAAHLSVWSV
ncbi:hypothetical protein GCM10023220_63390 [Streptomyces ziwulingensis]|uniref:Uncharacterized protein n=1 Tax=Streptomyces ziwulingensis TaxID=1045501 RepID=A0ABP9CX35_9ACTN